MWGSGFFFEGIGQPMNHYQFNVLLQSGRYKLNEQFTGTGSIITTE